MRECTSCGGEGLVVIQTPNEKTINGRHQTREDSSSGEEKSETLEAFIHKSDQEFKKWIQDSDMAFKKWFRVK